MNIYWFFATKD